MLFPVLMLTGAQLSQVFRNVTTNELSNAHRYQWLKDDDGRFAAAAGICRPRRRCPPRAHAGALGAKWGVRA